MSTWLGLHNGPKFTLLWIQLGVNVLCGPPSPSKGAALPIALQPQGKRLE